MLRPIGLFIVSIFLFLAAAGCATRPKAPFTVPDAEQSSVQAKAAGFAPSGDAAHRTMDFAMRFGNPGDVVSWRLAIVDGEQHGPVRTISGEGANLPNRFSWDGLTDGGSPATEGTYFALLEVGYGNKLKPSSALSQPIFLDIVPPSAAFSPNPARIAYTSSGAYAPVSVAISVKPGRANVASWSLEISDQAGGRVKTFGGVAPPSSIAWDGRTDAGGRADAMGSYRGLLSVVDEYGNKGSYVGTFAVAEAPSAPTCSIATRRRGFSPTSWTVKNTIDLLLSVGSEPVAQAWRVEIRRSGTVQAIRTFSGTAADVPQLLRWDGRDDWGILAPQGRYAASLTVDYGRAFKEARASSPDVVVVTRPPHGSITLAPSEAGLFASKNESPVDLVIQAKSPLAKIVGWTFEVYDPSNAMVLVLSGDRLNDRVAWGGKTFLPGTKYSFVAKVQDEYGNVGDLDIHIGRPLD
jgi:hypothetical protein